MSSLHTRGLVLHRFIGELAGVLPVCVAEGLNEVIVAEVNASLNGQHLRYLGLV